MPLVQISQIGLRLFETFLLNLSLSASEDEKLALVHEAAAVRDLVRRVPASLDLFPLCVPNVIPDRLQVDSPQVVVDAFVQVLPSEQVQVLAVRRVAHITATVRQGTFEDDIDPAIALEVRMMRVRLRDFELLLLAILATCHRRVRWEVLRSVL